MTESGKITDNLPEDWGNQGTRIPDGERSWDAEERPPADWFNYFFYHVIASLKDLDQNAIENLSSIPSLKIDTKSNRPAPGEANRLFIALDTAETFLDSGTSWEQIAADDLEPTEILDRIKNVDGEGSGLDTDTVRGRELDVEVDNHTANTNNPHNVTANQLGANKILAQIKEVDGASSGLNADLLDGKEAKDFMPSNQVIVPTTKPTDPQIGDMWLE